jgi:molybdopterin-guanine dinucleotide biosynthesis protein B
VRILQVIGGKKSGKTTTVRDFIRVASGLGLKVAAMKRAHEAVFDTPETDSYRFSEAGAVQVGLVVPGEFLWHEKREIGLAELVERTDADVLFVEGFRGETGYERLVMGVDAAFYAENLTAELLDFTTQEKREEWIEKWLMN